jgi:choline dehydrogenase-like flavoprotein
MLTFEVSVRTLNQDLTPGRLIRHGLDFVVRGRGAITSPAAHAVAFDTRQTAARTPDLELVFVAFGLDSQDQDEPEPADAGRPDGRLQRLVRKGMTRSSGRSGGYRQPASESLVRVLATVLHPLARGEVLIRSADPTAPPVIRHELLGERQDLSALIDGCRRAREVFAAPALADVVLGERVPGPAVQTDEQWEGFLRSSTVRMNHASGTCRMGADELSVVDPRLRVRGVDGLRVIDASIMPNLPSGNTNAPTMMIGEVGSRWVLEDNG